MAANTFPSISPDSMVLRQVNPGQQHVEGLYSGFRHVVTRGPGYWEGTVTWSRKPPSKRSMARQIESFIISMSGLINTAKIPVTFGKSDSQLGRFSSSTVLTATPIGVSSDVAIFGFSQQTGLFAGDRITIDDRLYVLVTDLAAGRANLWPAIIPSQAETAEWKNPYLIATRKDAGAIEFAKQGAWFGPWTMEFIEQL